MSGSADTSTSSADRTTARRGLVIFFVLVVVFEALLVVVLVRTGVLLWIFALMWSVALSLVVARLTLREGFTDVSFRLGGRRSLRYAIGGLIFPVVVGLVAFGIAWTTGLATLVSPLGSVAQNVLATTTVGTAVGVLSAAGEEIGWRGYLLIRLIDADVPHPVLISGLLWGLWHVPLIVTGIVFGNHPYRVLAVAVFLVSATAAAFVLARFRLEPGSVWPCIVLHAAYNSVIQGAFSPATAGRNAPIWVGEETGILVAAALVVGALILCRGAVDLPDARRTWLSRRPRPFLRWGDTGITGVLVGAKPAPGRVAEVLVTGERPVLDLPDHHRRHPVHRPTVGRTTRPAPSPGELGEETASQGAAADAATPGGGGGPPR